MNNAPIRIRVMALLCVVLMLLSGGCFQLPGAVRAVGSPGSIWTAERGFAQAPALRGKVDWGRRVLQDVIHDKKLGIGATVSIIDPISGQTQATTLSDSSGGFRFQFGTYEFPVDKTMFLECVKGLENNAPGNDAIRLRTFLILHDGEWYSLGSVHNGIVPISEETTAISIIQGYHSGDQALPDPTQDPNYINPSHLVNYGNYPEIQDVNGGLAPRLTSGAPSPSDGTTTTAQMTWNEAGVGDIVNADFWRVTDLVNQALSADTDPFYAVRFTGSSYYFQAGGGGSGGYVQIQGLSSFSGVPGDILTIFGLNFKSNPTDNTVTFNGTPALVTGASPTQLTVKVPNGAHSGLVIVETNQGTSNGLTFLVNSPPDGTYRPATAATISAITPSAALAGRTVTLTGTGFDTKPTGNWVTLNGQLASGSAATGGTSMGFVVPTRFTSGYLQALRAGAASNAVYLAVGAPILMGASITAAAPGMSVTFVGANFVPDTSANTVTFGGVPATSVTAATPNSITCTVPAGAVVGPVVITTTATSSAPFPFGVASSLSGVLGFPATASVTSISPNRGPTGIMVTLTGTGFSALPQANVVSFNGVPGTTLASTATTIDVVVPSGATTGPVTLMTVAGPVPVGTYTVNGPAVTSYTMSGVPVIGGITPGVAPIGATVRINGSNFDPIYTNNVVSFNGTTSIAVDGTSDWISVAVPPGATSGNLTVTHSGGTSLPQSFYVIPSNSGQYAPATAPSIGSVAPTSAKRGQSVTITGTNFWSLTSANGVWFNGVSATVSTCSATTLTVTVPATTPPGAGTLTVGTPSGVATQPYTINASTPTISSISPSQAAAGTLVTLTGTNFDPVASSNIVSFNGATATGQTVSGTSLTVYVPAAASSGSVTVAHAGGTSAGYAYTIIPSHLGTFSPGNAPTITTVSASAKKAGQTITITGTGFSTNAAGNAVWIAGRLATVTGQTATQLTVTVPSGTAVGDVVVATPTGQVSWGGVFSIVNGAPTFTSVSPSNIGYPGSVLTLNGSNFDLVTANNVVTFNGLQATPSACTATSITVPVPTNASSGNLLITNVGGTATQSFYVMANLTGAKFNPDVPPTVSSLNKTHAAVGASVTITGTGFWPITTANAVWFNGKSATISSASTTSLTVTVPAGATTGNLVVGSPSGQVTYGSFNVDPATPGAPTVVGSLYGAVGSTVTINGSNFDPVTGNNTITFNGIATTPLDGTTSSLTVVVPVGATTGPLTVTNGSGTSPATTTFYVIGNTLGTISHFASPSISTVSPSSASVNTTVTITGGNFVAATTADAVWFNGVRSSVLTATSTQLTAKVPVGATTGPLVVSTPGGQVLWSGTFTVALAGVPTTSGVSPSAGVAGTTVVISGTNFDPVTANNTVSFNGVLTVPTAGTATSLTVVVPPGASSNNLKVTTTGGTSNAQNFSVLSSVGGTFDP